MLTRRHIMKGRGFQRMDPERLREQRQDSRAASIDMLLATTGRSGVTMVGASSGHPIDKERASQSSAYQVAVRSLGYCMRCGCTLPVGKRQFCHADEGKGTSIKTDVRRGWIGCSGCHFHIGTAKHRPRRELRREIELYLAWKTRCALRKKNLWPRSLPDTWVEHDQTPMMNPEAHSA